MRFTILVLLASVVMQCLPVAVHSQPITDPQGDVGIGTVAPHPSAILDLTSLSKGFLLTRVTVDQRDAIVRPATGLMIYNLVDSTIEINCGDEITPVWCPILFRTPTGTFSARLNPGSVWYGGSDSTPVELPISPTGSLFVSNGTEPIWVANPGGLLPVGTAPNTTLAWDPTANGGAGAWVENTNLRSNPATGNTTINGTSVAIPNVPNVTTGTTVVITDGAGNVQTINLDDLIGNASLSQNALWVGDPANNPAELSAGTVDQVLQINAVGAPTWRSINLLPNGTANNTTLVWDNVASEWIENTNVTSNPTNGNTDINGNLNVDGSTVSLPNIPTTTTSTTVVVTDGAGNVQITDIDDLIGNASLSQNALWVGNAANNPVELAGGAAGQVLTINGAGAPVWGNTPYWGLTGNSATVDAVNFLGTIDNVPLNIRVNNQRAFRIVPGASPNIIGGYNTNSIAGGLTGGTISGGGSAGAPNRITAGNIGTISGGQNNAVSADAATIGGGEANTASAVRTTVGGGVGNTASGPAATVGGGASNIASSNQATVSGGLANVASGPNSAVSGGSGNNASGSSSVISGGISNVTTAQNGTIGGGGSNSAGFYGTVAGGQTNVASGPHSSISGGRDNQASGSWVTIGGGDNNQASGNYTVVAGGNLNNAASAGTAILGGQNNMITAGGGFSAIIGGRGLTLSGSQSFGFNANDGVGAVGTSPMSITATHTAVFGSVDLWLANNQNRASQIRFYEPNGTVGAFPPVGTNYSAFVQNDPLATDITYDLPPTLNTGAINQQRFMRATTTTANIAAQLDWVDAATIVGQSGWLLTGNGGTNPATNFLGTTDAQALVVRTNNVERFRVDPVGRVGIAEINPLHRLHVVNTDISDEVSAIYGLANQVSNNQSVGVWGDASNTGGANTGTIALLATGNGNTTAGQTNVALQVNDGEVTMGRTTQAPGVGTVVEGATAGTAYSAQGPSGVVELTLGGGNLTTVAPVSGTFQNLGTVTVNNRYVTSQSIVLVNVLSKVDEGTAPNPENSLYFVDVDNRASGSFVIRIGMIPTVTNGSNFQNTDAIRIGYTVINPSR